MATSLSAKKRIRQNIRHRSRNRWRLRAMRLSMREFREKLLHGTPEEARESLRKCGSLIDRAAARGVIHKNNAARKKSRLNARLKARHAQSA
ncbi:MAG: 30S ribosomal protein S20 [Phycisphaeraceae bacterium]|nr:MAG: 30S ribosomal protein S20 [Phycisphaeraceae bacterium]